MPPYYMMIGHKIDVTMAQKYEPRAPAPQGGYGYVFIIYYIANYFSVDLFLH